MNIESFSIHVSESLGTVSAEVVEAAHPAAVMVLAHGAGAGMHHPFMKSLSLALGESGITTLRYNFPYMEKSGRGRPDPPAIAEKTVEVALHTAHQRYGNLPVIGSGKSFGGRMTSQRLAKGGLPFVRGLVFFGFPLHAPGKVSSDRATHLSAVSVPMLFHQGTRDTLADIETTRSVVASLSGGTMVEYDGADHSFKAGKRQLMPDLVRHTVDWLANILSHRRA